MRQYLVQLYQYAPRPADPTFGSSTPIDLTDRVQLDGLGSITKAIEQDFLSFRTGDVTLLLDNADGEMDALFADLAADARWWMSIDIDGARVFAGVVLGQGSVRSMKYDEEVEVTIYGATRILEDTSAENVKRTFSDMTLTGSHSAAATVLNMNTTAGLLPKDTLHIRHTNGSTKEDVTIRYVNSSTQVTITAGLANGYPADSAVDMTSPFYRYKSIEFLSRALFDTAFVPIAEYVTTPSQFAGAAPTRLSHGGLGTTKALTSPGAERNGRVYSILDTVGSYYQDATAPDTDWVQEDATLRPWVDWSRYRKQSDSAPTIILRFPDAIGATLEEWLCAVDDRDAATKYVYRARFNVSNLQMQRNSTTDGTTWGGWADHGAIGPVPVGLDIVHHEFDQVRGQVYVQMSNGGIGGTIVATYLYDVGANAWSTVNLATPQAEGLRYIPEHDYLLGNYFTASNFMAFAAYRNGATVFDRTPTLPSHLKVGSIPTGGGKGYGYPAQGARYVNGRVHMVVVFDGAICMLSSADDWQTARVAKVIKETSWSGGAFGSRVNGAYYFWPYGSNAVIDREYHLAAPFHSGVVGYADFEGKSVAEAMGDLAVIANAVFWVDDDLQGHFASRDAVQGATPVDITGDIIDRSDAEIWEEARQFVNVSGGGFEAGAGNADFSADAHDITAEFLPNEAYAIELAQVFYDFYSKRRRLIEAETDDLGAAHAPLDRVVLEGQQYLVHQVDRDLVEEKHRLTLLEDLEAA